MITAMNIATTNADRYERMAAAIEFIAQNAREQPSLQRIASSAGMSEFHFAREFRRWAGISPKQFLQRLSLDVAQLALRQESSVLEAALEAGLSGAGRLHDLFVALEAVSPGEFKARGAGLVFRHGRAGTPFGEAWLVTTPRGIAFLGFSVNGAQPDGWATFLSHWNAGNWVHDDAAAERVVAQIWSEGTRARTRELRLWVHGSNFQIQVWQALLRRACDLTVNYSDIAREIGRPAAARAVGNAVGANPVAWLIPCHHVLRSNGALGGYRWGLERKRAMLAWEYSRTIASG